ncbi:MAG: hypothetical protein VYE22_09700 [Myxococcota bacterium]|nr:hypothetical protein [Myxococcota bacterium]
MPHVGTLQELLGKRTVELAERLVAPGSFPQISASEGHELSDAVLHAAALVGEAAGEPSTRVYRFDGIEVPGAGRGWAAFYVDDTHGTLALVSDWGTWSHRWWRGPWLCESQHLSDALGMWVGADYVARKLFAGVPDEFDGRATVKGWRAEVLEARRSGGLTRDEARAAWRALDELDSSAPAELLLQEALADEDLHRVIADDYWESAVYRKPHSFGVVKDALLPLLFEALRKEQADA